MVTLDREEPRLAEGRHGRRTEAGYDRRTLSDPDVVLYAAGVSVRGRWFVWLTGVFLLAYRPGFWYPGNIELLSIPVLMGMLNGLMHLRLLTNRPARSTGTPSSSARSTTNAQLALPSAQQWEPLKGARRRRPTGPPSSRRTSGTPPPRRSRDRRSSVAMACCPPPAGTASSPASPGAKETDKQ